MKKQLALLALIPFVTACTFGGSDTPQATEGKAPKNPEKTFQELTTKHNNAWADTVSDLLPEMADYTQTESAFALNAEATIPETGGTLNLTITAESASDFSRENDPLAQSTIAIKGSLDGDFAGAVETTLQVQVVNDGLYLSLADLDVSIPNVPASELNLITQGFVGQWFGDSFETIKQLSGGQLDIKQAIMSRAKGVAAAQADILNLIRNAKLFSYKASLPSENGFFLFEVELSKESLRDTVLSLLTLSNAPQSEIDRLSTEMDAELEKATLTGTLGILAADPKYFTFSGAVTNTDFPDDSLMIDASFLEGEKTLKIFSVQKETGAELTITSSEAGDAFTFSLLNKQEKKVFFQGTRGEAKISLEVFDPEAGIQLGKMELVKEGEVWGGMITTDQSPDILVEISNLRIDKENATITLVAKNGETLLGKADITSEVHEGKALVLTAPEGAQSFQSLLPLILGASGGFGGGGHGEIDPALVDPLVGN